MIDDLHTAFLLGVAIAGAGWAFDHWYMARSLDHAAERAHRLQSDLMAADTNAAKARRKIDTLSDDLLVARAALSGLNERLAETERALAPYRRKPGELCRKRQAKTEAAA